MAESGIDRTTDEFGSSSCESVSFFTESSDLGGADEGEVERPEEEDHPAVLVLSEDLLEFDLVEVALEVGVAFEVGGRLAHSGHLGFLCHRDIIMVLRYVG